jgi:hypothetical protein
LDAPPARSASVDASQCGEKLVTVDDERGRTGLAWIREWPEAPSQKNLAGIVERLEAVRRIGQEASLTDAGIIMFDKMLGSMFRRADHEHRERMVDRAKALDAATRTLLGWQKPCWPPGDLALIHSSQWRAASAGAAWKPWSMKPPQPLCTRAKTI